MSRVVACLIVGIALMLPALPAKAQVLSMDELRAGINRLERCLIEKMGESYVDIAIDDVQSDGPLILAIGTFTKKSSIGGRFGHKLGSALVDSLTGTKSTIYNDDLTDREMTDSFKIELRGKRLLGEFVITSIIMRTPRHEYRSDSSEISSRPLAQCV